MPNQKNIEEVKRLSEKVKQAKSIVLADYRGLPVNLQQKLRRQIREAGGELLVAKNTLLNIALKQEKVELPKDFATLLQGPTITLLAYEDEVAPIKALAEFAKENKLPQVKCGFLGKESLSADKVEELSKLPTKLDMIAKTVGTIKAPLTGFVNVLSGNLRNLIYALEAIKQKKGGE